MPSADLFPMGNNAPQPIPGGYGNPTGANTGFNFGNAPGGNLPFPTMNQFGVPGQGGGGPAYNVGAYGTGAGLAGLSSGFSTNDPGRTQNLYNYLGKAYGKGPGQLLGNMITQGLFNPQVAAAFLNAQAPGIARGEAGIQSSFGDAGARFSSAAALGMGDFESQVQLNQQQTLAQLFENAQQQQMGLLQNVLPAIQNERANEGGWINDVIGGLEIGGGALVDAFTGGLGGNSLIAGGFNKISGSGKNQQAQPGGGGGGDLASVLARIMNPNNNQNVWDGGKVGGVSDPALNQPSYMPMSTPSYLQMDAGNLWGENLGMPTNLPLPNFGY